MAANETSFPPGRSGNPKGRPPKKRALTNLLERYGNKRPGGSGTMTYKEMVISRLWEGAATGQIDYGDGRVVALGKDVVAMARMILLQVDGPPPAAIDVTSNGETVQGGVTIIEVHPPAGPEDE